ncbi:MAG: hypothetical protein PHQ20_02100 [Candidatus Moranbacteria bacterium]|nr:hypothetical protein [Candidatus Moranbacteria bacterium]
MKIREFIQLLGDKKGMVILFGVLLAALTFWGAIIANKNFQARADVLIVQNQNGYSDYYALSRSADYLSQVLTESIYSERFIQKVAEKNIVNIDNMLPKDKSEKLKKWNQMVKVTKKSDTGLLSIETYGGTPTEAVQTSEAVLKVLTEDYYIFLGRGQDLDVRVLSGPILEKTFGMLSLVFIIFGGFVIGCLLAIVWFYFSYELKEGVSYQD